MLPLRIRYQTREFKSFDIHLRTLRDLTQFGVHEDSAESEVPMASWPLFGVVWESGEVLAHLMDDYDVAGRRVLEVGCGIGVASLVLNSRGADVTATDYHPDAQQFLDENVRLNGGRVIPFVRAGWGKPCPDLRRFDLIIGSDLLYETGHLDALAQFIDDHAAACCEVLIVDPGRGLQMQFSEKMERLGYTSSYSIPEKTDYLLNRFNGRTLRYVR